MSDCETITELEHCTIEDIGMEITGEDAPPLVAAINEYLSAFAKPAKCDQPGSLTGTCDCLKCGRRLNGLLGTFTWGMVNGEGYCSNCHWPARYYHDIKDAEGERIFDRRLELHLQYHPDYVTQGDVNETASEEELT